MTLFMSSRGGRFGDRRGDLSLVRNTSEFATLPSVARNDKGRQPPLSNGTIGMMLLVGTETVLFTCFISAYIVLRSAAGMWPPAGTPHLRLGLSSVNTAVLVLSSVLAFSFGRSMAREIVKVLIGLTLALGSLFLVLQGVEFHALYQRGLTLQTGPYGAVFFSLISCHGLHVLGGLVFLAAVLGQLVRAKDPERMRRIRKRVAYAEIYWHFVTAVWLILFGILYVA
jgi:cytochrome c oxidase subunit 3